MKRLAALLLAAVLAAVILQPIAAGVNNSFDNSGAYADGVMPLPPFPPGGYTPA